VDPIRRYLEPPVAAAVIGLLVAAQLAAMLAFSLSYAARGHRIVELEASVCRERMARIAPLTADVSCPDVEKIFAQALPQVWKPIAQTRWTGSR
jgi:hypothetical protein